MPDCFTLTAQLTNLTEQKNAQQHVQVCNRPHILACDDFYGCSQTPPKTRHVTKAAYFLRTFL